MATTPVLPGGFELPLEPRLPRLGSVDAVALEERAAALATRSIKRDSKVFALDLAIRVMDLTTLEGADTPGKVAALASKGIRLSEPRAVRGRTDEGHEREGRGGRDGIPVGAVIHGREAARDA